MAATVSPVTMKVVIGEYGDGNIVKPNADGSINVDLSSGGTPVSPTNPLPSIGLAKAASVTITRSNNTTAYPANSVVGGAQSFPSLGTAGQQIMITSSTLMVNDSAIISGETSYILYLYNVTPPSAYTDNTAWDLPSGDRASFLGFISLGAVVDLGSTLWVEQNILNTQVTLVGTGLFGYLVTVGAYTPTASRVYVPGIHTVTLGS